MQAGDRRVTDKVAAILNRQTTPRYGWAGKRGYYYDPGDIYAAWVLGRYGDDRGTRWLIEKAARDHHNAHHQVFDQSGNPWLSFLDLTEDKLLDVLQQRDVDIPSDVLLAAAQLDYTRAEVHDDRGWARSVVAHYERVRDAANAILAKLK